MRFFPPGRRISRRLEPTPTEAFVRHEFGDAIAFAGKAWLAFEAGFKEADPQWPHGFSLAQRLAAFMAGPIGASLEERFPAIAATGAAADDITDRTGNKWVITVLIVAEAVIAAGGGSRAELRRALPS